MDSRVLESALRALSRYPLCDRCLGRLFARLGRGWSNRERGEAVKRVLVMELHRRVLEGDEAALKTLVSAAPNIGEVARDVVEHLSPGSYREGGPCAVCGGRLESVIASAVEEGYRLLRAYDIERFVVGVRLERGVAMAEEEVKLAAGAGYGESIKAEIRREVGKLLVSRGGVTVDFDSPEATLMVEFPGGGVDIQVNSLLYKARYWKLARNISQAYWPTPEGPRYFSVEQALWPVLKLTGGERLVVHAAGREDVDARMLGSGRPMIVEVKSPRRRRIPLEELEAAANAGGKGLVRFRFETAAKRAEVALYKEETARVRKVYRALVAVEGGVSEVDVEGLRRALEGAVIMQRTPSRVLHRRPDILRRRRLYSLDCSPLEGAPLMECILEAEGGLYIKELVSGDGGRTRPSFAEVLGREAVCIELDVVWVEHEAPAAPG
ncbi:putative pseudouridine synthase PsuX [Aeropyrum pernix K1]|uniref:tRNA pseudouridine synthase Pus10 n=1 Tax=Aeropyrum pernix (strain ATCC 700893 / DSM 11879 / JCM 9820 / NBRC 100138 / K1) TaxID=272557 RepID=PUS10_AERPE|nr:tRNA pseudouridine(54/55) synthase Pus10 [Aeropyrum pernix]Q9YEN2.2 RecName: Full=tRNA pseudouridine synthase Pus10; AltName: Full=tRNA pseudouridine 54/55 synthase; Short=Psi54/55 synthase [Aeropyrum pernix K1]BAA79514.2 putative pseudouridine synthase PsuX [Aeropyrum pernix K1]